MRKSAVVTFCLGSLGALMILIGQAPPGAQVSRRPPMPPGPNPDSQYRLGPDSMPQDGVPKGEVRGPFTLPSNVYPGTQHTYWVYVPAQYDPAVPASLRSEEHTSELQSPY